jgi:hypothetical protein
LTDNDKKVIAAYLSKYEPFKSMKYPFLRYLVKFFKVREFENCQMLKCGDPVDFCIVLLKGNLHLNTNSELSRGGLYSLSKRLTEEKAGTSLLRKT